jgi:hypothetical protein
VKIDPSRKDSSVDLMIGNGFNVLSTPADAAKARIVAANPPPPKPVCTAPTTAPAKPKG